MVLSSKKNYREESNGDLAGGIMRLSFVTKASHLLQNVGDSLAKVRGKYFLIVLAVQGK